jgi:amidohydrolase
MIAGYKERRNVLIARLRDMEKGRKMDFLKEAESIKDRIVSWRRHLHEYPEPSGEERETSEYVADVLEKIGVRAERNYGAPCPGVLGRLRGGKQGEKAIALRADMDALKIVEPAGLPFASRNRGVMHACGHDAHVAIQLGAAALLAKHRDELCGEVRFIFEAAEEGTGGAMGMIKAGALEGVGRIFALHVMPGLASDEAGIRDGQLMAASDFFSVTIRGVSSHAARPHQGVDAIVVAASCIVALQSVISRFRDPLDPVVLTFGTIAGGEQPNALANEVTFQGPLRTMNPDTREKMVNMIKRVIENTTQMFGAGCKIDHRKSHPAIINDSASVEFLLKAATDVLPEDKIVIPMPLLTTESFARYLEKTPGAMWYVGTGFDEALHSTTFHLDENCLVTGAAIQANLAWKYLNGNKENDSI